MTTKSIGMALVITLSSALVTNFALAAQPKANKIAESNLTNDSPTPVIDREHLQEKMATSSNLILVDALPKEYFVLSHIPKSINIPFEDAEKLCQPTIPNKKADIVVYCMDRK